MENVQPNAALLRTSAVYRTRERTEWTGQPGLLGTWALPLPHFQDQQIPRRKRTYSHAKDQSFCLVCGSFQEQIHVVMSRTPFPWVGAMRRGRPCPPAPSPISSSYGMNPRSETDGVELRVLVMGRTQWWRQRCWPREEGSGGGCGAV